MGRAGKLAGRQAGSEGLKSCILRVRCALGSTASGSWSGFWDGLCVDRAAGSPRWRREARRISGQRGTGSARWKRMSGCLIGLGEADHRLGRTTHYPYKIYILGGGRAGASCYPATGQNAQVGPSPFALWAAVD
uniref:Uncharacterized protein n=1 Tax=Zea mays TaxID=4577 RepID=C4IZJ8_MAIZE|nr:unknown [Zea mays]